MCQQCKCRQTNIHDYYPREISELPILGKNVIVHEGNRSMYYDIKSSRWILLGNNKNLNQSAKDKLAEVLALNRPLEIAYMLKEQIRDLYFCVRWLEPKILQFHLYD